MKKKQVILIADGSQVNRKILVEILENSYTLIEAETGREAIEIVKERKGIDVILLDVRMPDMEGFEVLRTMNQWKLLDDIPVILISEDTSLSIIEIAYDLGVIDYISKPFDAALVKRRVVNTLLLYAKQKRLSRLVEDQVYKREENNNLMINILSQIVGARNGESRDHILRIRRITELLLGKLIRKQSKYVLSKEALTNISFASALHDIGKIDIPKEVLNKPGRLTKEEFEIMKRHTMIGANIVKEISNKSDLPLVETAYQICRWHHERYDGRGYPDGLAGDEIPIAAQIVSLADVYDALTSKRCYKEAIPHEVAMKMIQNEECGVFNPILLECLLECEEDLKSGFTI